ncbi:MAG: Uma2 family endonuclease [Gemmataceae bacterium]|nr:Uma2 family endonuclease [Planctomycetia bacterium]MBX3399769.1 Uma2 family endonuclease [Gemmataceae bacterium]
MTADEFLRLHGDESGIELIDGQIVRLPMPGLEHGEVCANVAIILGNHVKSNRLGRLFTNDSFVRLGADRVRGPDVLYISYQTMPADVPTPKGAYAPPLELVVEVRSPFNTIREMTLKADEYLAAGVKVVLIVEPESASVGVFRSDELPQRFHNGDILELPDVLPGFAVPVKRFFE